jgi:hypothetical protein
MSEGPNIEIAGQITRPEISTEGLAHYKDALREYERLIADPAATPDIRARYEALRQSVSNALAVTGQSLAPSDPRSPPQQHFDGHFAMEPSPQLVEMCHRDSKGTEPPDPERTATALAGIGLTHKDALELAQHAVDHSQQLAGVRVENLPAISLAVLARFGAHLRQYQPKRPQ